MLEGYKSENYELEGVKKAFLVGLINDFVINGVDQEIKINSTIYFECLRDVFKTLDENVISEKLKNTTDNYNFFQIVQSVYSEIDKFDLSKDQIEILSNAYDDFKVRLFSLDRVPDDKLLELKVLITEINNHDGIQFDLKSIPAENINAQSYIDVLSQVFTSFDLYLTCYLDSETTDGVDTVVWEAKQTQILLKKLYKYGESLSSWSILQKDESVTTLVSLETLELKINQLEGIVDYDLELFHFLEENSGKSPLYLKYDESGVSRKIKIDQNIYPVNVYQDSSLIKTNPLYRFASDLSISKFTSLRSQLSKEVNEALDYSVMVAKFDSLESGDEIELNHKLLYYISDRFTFEDGVAVCNDEYLKNDDLTNNIINLLLTFEHNVEKDDDNKITSIKFRPEKRDFEKEKIKRENEKVNQLSQKIIKEVYDESEESKSIQFSQYESDLVGFTPSMKAILYTSLIEFGLNLKLTDKDVSGKLIKAEVQDGRFVLGTIVLDKDYIKDGKTFNKGEEFILQIEYSPNLNLSLPQKEEGPDFGSNEEMKELYSYLVSLEGDVSVSYGNQDKYRIYREIKIGDKKFLINLREDGLAGIQNPLNELAIFLAKGQSEFRENFSSEVNLTIDYAVMVCALDYLNEQFSLNNKSNVELDRNYLKHFDHYFKIVGSEVVLPSYSSGEKYANIVLKLLSFKYEITNREGSSIKEIKFTSEKTVVVESNEVIVDRVFNKVIPQIQASYTALGLDKIDYGEEVSLQVVVLVLNKIVQNGYELYWEDITVGAQGIIDKVYLEDSKIKISFTAENDFTASSKEYKKGDTPHIVINKNHHKVFIRKPEIVDLSDDSLWGALSEISREFEEFSSNLSRELDTNTSQYSEDEINRFINLLKREYPNIDDLNDGREYGLRELLINYNKIRNQNLTIDEFVDLVSSSEIREKEELYHSSLENGKKLDTDGEEKTKKYFRNKF